MVDKQELDLYQLDFFLGSIFLFQTICTINSKIDSQYPFHWSYLTYGRSDSYEIAIDNYQADEIAIDNHQAGTIDVVNVTTDNKLM